jgi:hypothetical protein
MTSRWRGEQRQRGKVDVGDPERIATWQHGRAGAIQFNHERTRRDTNERRGRLTSWWGCCVRNVVKPDEDVGLHLPCFAFSTGERFLLRESG